MEAVRLGSTGLKVSRLALGCMSYGDPTTPGAHEWSLNDAEAEPYFRQAVELGITFWDTANVYQAGTSEELVGRAIKRYSRREDIVLATKVRGRCTTARVEKACRARRSWNRSTPRSRDLMGSFGVQRTIPCLRRRPGVTGGPRACPSPVRPPCLRALGRSRGARTCGGSGR